jgi:hypothetical protein
MYLTDIVNNQTTVFNTGVASLAKSFGSIVGMLVVPKAWTLTATEMAVFMDSIKADLIEDDEDERIRLIGRFHTSEIANGDKTTVTHPDGSEDISRGATAGWRFITNNGGTDYMKILQSYDGKDDSYNIVLITKPYSQGKGHSFWGTWIYNTTTKEKEFTGFDLSKLEVETPMVGEFSDVDRYPLGVRLADKDQLFTNGWCIETDINAFGASVLPQIHDVQLTQLSAANGSGVFTLGMALGSGAINLAEAANASTWANVANIRAFNKSSGAAITVSSVTINAGGFVVTLDSNDTDYPSAGDLIGIELVSVSTLASAGLKYYESVADNPQIGGRSRAIYIIAA